MVLRPKQDLGAIAASPNPRCLGLSFFCWWFGGKNEPTTDAMSMVNFEPDYQLN